jgi:hypothetical protein
MGIGDIEAGSIYLLARSGYAHRMRLGDLAGWAAAVVRAKERWPEIPGWAYDLAAEEDTGERTYEEAAWFSVHPVTAAEAAVRAACKKGWRFERRHL